MSEAKSSLFGKIFTGFIIVLSLLEIGAAIYGLAKGKLKMWDIKIKMDKKGKIAAGLSIVANLILSAVLIAMFRAKEMLSSKAYLVRIVYLMFYLQSYRNLSLFLFLVY